MSHAIDYNIYDYKTDKKKIYADVVEWASHNVDREENPFGSYHGNFKFYDLGLKGKKEAQDWVRRNLEKGNYTDGAVSFYDYGDMKDTSQIAKIKESAKKIRDMAYKYLIDHSIQMQKASYIGCKNEKCESKISREYMSKYKTRCECDWNDRENKYVLKIDQQKCPVCGADLRAEYIVVKQKEFEDKINMFDKKLKELENAQKEKNFKKATKQWFVKMEEHC